MVETEDEALPTSKDQRSITEQAQQAIIGAAHSAVLWRWEPAKQRAHRAAGATVEERVARVTRDFEIELSTVGAATGGVAAVPGLGIPATIATVAGELGWTTMRFSDLILTIAAVHGHDRAAVEDRLGWVLSILAFGNGAADAFENLAAQLGRGLGGRATGQIPFSWLQTLNRFFGRTLVTKYGSKRGAIVIGRALPFGIGAGIGAGANYLMVRTIAGQADRFFRQLPPEGEVARPPASLAGEDANPPASPECGMGEPTPRLAPGNDKGQGGAGEVVVSTLEAAGTAVVDAAGTAAKSVGGGAAAAAKETAAAASKVGGAVQTGAGAAASAVSRAGGAAASAVGGAAGGIVHHLPFFSTEESPHVEAGATEAQPGGPKMPDDPDIGVAARLAEPPSGGPFIGPKGSEQTDWELTVELPRDEAFSRLETLAGGRCEYANRSAKAARSISDSESEWQIEHPRVTFGLRISITRRRRPDVMTFHGSGKGFELVAQAVLEEVNALQTVIHLRMFLKPPRFVGRLVTDALADYHDRIGNKLVEFLQADDCSTA